MDYISNFISQYGALFAQGTVDTLVMTLASTLFAYLIGVPLGVLLVITAKDGLKPQRALNTVLGWIVNIGRSIPFIILLVAIIPFTRLVVGTSLGVPGAIVPLTVAAIPFVGRMVEQSLAEVDGGLVEAAQSFGANTWQIVCKVMLRDSLPSLVRGASITVITLFGYTAMAGAVGAGGIGDIAIRYGYQRYLGDVMIASIVLCIVLVQVFQSIGDLVARLVDKRVRRVQRANETGQQLSGRLSGRPFAYVHAVVDGKPRFPFASSMPRARNPLATCADIISLSEDVRIRAAAWPGA